MIATTSTFARESLPIGTLSGVSEIEADRVSEHLTSADIHEFQQLVRDNCGVWLDDGEAWARATQLVDLLRMFMRPLPEDSEASVIQAGSSVVSLDRLPGSALP